MRFAVTGGRDYDDYQVVERALRCMPADAVMVNDCASGADTLALEIWEGLWQRPAARFPAQWDKYGRSAGPIRNQAMLNSGIDLLIAFPGRNGTKHMTDICFRAGVPVVQCG